MVEPQGLKPPPRGVDGVTWQGRWRLGSWGGLALALALIARAAAGARAERSDVREELRQASRALDRVWQQVGDEDAPQDVYDLDAMGANLAHTDAARDLAMRLGRERAATLADVSEQADENLYEYLDDAAWAPPEIQPALAAAADTALHQRGATVRAMLARAHRLAPGVRATVLRAITDALSDGDPDLLLENLADEGGATVPVKQALAGSLKRMLVDTEATLDDLRRVAARLTRGEREKVERAIDEIRDGLTELPGWADELLADIADYAVDPDDAAQGFCDLLADLPLPRPSACPHGRPPATPADPPGAPPRE